MPKLSKTIEYAARYLASQNKSAEDIAKELKAPLKQIQSLLSDKKESIANSKTDKTKNLMIRQTSAKKQNSVSIVTEAASQLGDEYMKYADDTKKRTEGYIFRPKQND